MIGNDKTFKLTVPQVRLFLNPSLRPHHATLKSLKVQGLLDQDGWFTLTGQAVRDEVVNRMWELKKSANVSREEAAVLLTNSRKVHVIVVKDADRAASTFTAEEWGQLKGAIHLVSEDRRANWYDDEEFSTLAALEDVWNTVALPGRGCVGATEMDDTGDDLSEAYKLVLTYPKAVRQVVEFGRVA